jgi:hypothetical protein
MGLAHPLGLSDPDNSMSDPKKQAVDTMPEDRTGLIALIDIIARARSEGRAEEREAIIAFIETDDLLKWTTRGRLVAAIRARGEPAAPPGASVDDRGTGESK